MNLVRKFKYDLRLILIVVIESFKSTKALKLRSNVPIKRQKDGLFCLAIG